MSEGNITLSVKFLIGKNIEIEINQNCTVEKLAQEISKRESILVNQTYLAYKSKWIFPDQKNSKLVDLSIKNWGCIIRQLPVLYVTDVPIRFDNDVNNTQFESVIENENSSHTWSCKRKLVTTIGVLSSVVILMLFALLLLLFKSFFGDMNTFYIFPPFKHIRFFRRF